MTELARDARPPLIELHGVTRIYGAGQAAVAALAGIDVRIERAEFLAVMGPSGSGKSTCMNVDLPDPLAPVMATNSPCVMPNETPQTAGTCTSPT